MSIDRHPGPPAGLEGSGAGGFRDRALMENGLVVAALLGGLLLLSGITMPLVGVVYGLDLLAPLAVLAFLLFHRGTASFLARFKGSLFFGAFFIVASLLLDLGNHSAYQYLFRGVGENVGCYMTFVLGLCCLGRFGLGGFFLVYVSSSLSIPLWMVLKRDPMIFSLITFFKFYNGMFIILPVIYLTRRSKLVTGGCLLAYAGFLYTACDFRSGAAIAAATAFWLLGLPLMMRLKPWLIGLIIVLALPIGTTVFLAYSYNRQLDNMDVVRAQRGEMSNAERYDMAADAVTRIKAHPWLGYGSWQHVLLYDGSAFGGTDINMTGVHNLLLQLALEYGLVGLLIALAIGILLLRVLSRISVYGYGRHGLPPGMMALLLYVLLYATNGYIFGGIMGFCRFYLGFQYALIVWCDRLFSDMAQERRLGSTRRWGRDLPPAAADLPGTDLGEQMP
jgi:O-antigen ligase